MAGTQVKLVLVATTAGTHAVSAGLVSVGGMALIHHWLASLKHTPRLLPLADKVFIVTSPATHDAFVHWASDRDSSMGFPSSNLLCVAETGSSMVDALAVAAQEVPSLQQGHVVLASLDFFLGLGLPLQQLVERMVIRGKDTVVFTRPLPGAPMDNLSQVILDPSSITITGEMLNPRVAQVLTQAHGEADGMETAALAPLMLIHRSSLPLILCASFPQGPNQLAYAAAALLSKKPVYGLHLDMALRMTQGYDVAYANAFCDFLYEQLQAESKAGPAAQALAIVISNAHETGVTTRGDRGVEQLLNSVSHTKQALLKFDVLSSQILAAREAVLNKTGPTVRHGPRALPDRFADATTRRHTPHKQHPVYETTANQIGRRKPTNLDMPDSYRGSTGNFTKKFAPFTARSALVTAVSKSKVHTAFDDF